MISINESAISKNIHIDISNNILIIKYLSAICGVQTKVLKQLVKRNIDRFPEDFMFEMTKNELQHWRSQFVTSNADGSLNKGLRYMPFCFIEQGVAMLSSVLSSDKAIIVNIQIIRLFTKMREILYTHKDILLKLEKIERKTEKYDIEIQLIFNALKELLQEPEKIKEPIGFKINGISK